MTADLHPGASVRLVNDPGRIGTLTDRSRRRGNTTVYQVRFVESASWYPEYELEPAEGDALDVFDLLHKRRFGRVRDLRRNLTRIQLSGRLADMVYSMEATNTDFYAYQYKPVIAMLESPSNGLLIADEVGLGKTIEAGLIWTELRARYDARRLVIVCPSMLREKWRDELDRRFGVQARIVNADELRRELEKPRAQVRDGQALIGSMQGLRPPRGWRDADRSSNARAELARFLDSQAEEVPLIDLLVIDEAHYLRNPESQTARLGALMREVSEHVALLSATPINLRDRDLYQLLNLADPDSFSDEHTFPLVLQANEPLQRARQVVLQRDAEPKMVVEALEMAAESPILSGNRQLRALLSLGAMADEMSTVAGRSSLADRIERINPLRHVITRTRKRDVHERRVIREPHPEFVSMTEAERDFYQRVTEAIRDYALHADINAGFLLASPQRQVASCMVAAARHWGAPATDADDTNRELTYGNFGSTMGDDTGASPLISHLAGRVLPHVDVAELEADDSKFTRLSALLGEFLREYPGEKVVLFSYFRDTLRYLLRRLGDLGISGELLMGGMRETKQQVIDRFRTNDVQVLISSEVAAEGVDMQFCRLLINYDLPWNPMRVEQRIGRLDRIGQKANRIDIWNLGYADTIDERIYHRLFERLKLFERALGGMEAVLGEATRQLTLDLLADKLTPEQEQLRIDQTALAVENRRREEERLENEASSLIAHGGRILEQIHEARDFHHRVTSDDLLIFVRDYLERYYAGFELTPDGDEAHRFRLRLPRELCGELDGFLKRRHLLGQTRLATNDVVNCVFANKVTAATRQLETISQFHPLVRFITEDLRKRDERDYPLVGMMLGTEALPKGIAEGDYVFAVRRWTFSGLRTEEVLESVLLPVGASSDKAVRGEAAMQVVHLARLRGSDWEDPSSEHALEILEGGLDDCQQLLEEAFSKARESWQYENEDRVNFQKDTATRHRDRQLGRRKDTLEKYQASGRTRLVPAMKGQIRNIERRFDANIARLDAQARATASHDDVCYGMLRLGGKTHGKWTENHPQDPA